MSILNTRAARRELIVDIIRGGAVASQSDLVELLRERGIDVTQATVSRDLDELGAVKAMSADGRLALRGSRRRWGGTAAGRRARGHRPAADPCG